MRRGWKRREVEKKRRGKERNGGGRRGRDALRRVRLNAFKMNHDFMWVIN